MEQTRRRNLELGPGRDSKLGLLITRLKLTVIHFVDDLDLCGGVNLHGRLAAAQAGLARPGFSSDPDHIIEHTQKQLTRTNAPHHGI